MGKLKNIVGIIEAASSWDDVVSVIKRKNTTSQSVDGNGAGVCMDDIPDSIRNELLTDDEYVILRGHTISDEDDNED